MNHVYLFLICFIAGGLGSLLQSMIGVGVGIIMIPVLTFLLPLLGIPAELSIHVALGTSMACIIVSSLVGLAGHQRRHNIVWPVVKKMAVFAMLGAILGALLASHLPGVILERIFGIFLLCTAIHLWIKKSFNEADTTRRFPFYELACAGTIIGFVASIVGIGGGLLMVPFFHWKKFAMRFAVGTTIALSLSLSLAATATYMLSGTHQIHAAGTIGFFYWPAFVAISCATFIGAPLGTRLASRLSTTVLLRIFATLLLLIGLKMLLG